MQNADAGEIAKFAARADDWWDPSGPFKTLHDINGLRADYIAERAALANARVLDVGCGGGLLSEALADRGASVLGIDLADPSLDVARAHAAERGVAIEYHRVDVEALARERPASFEVVT